MFWSTAMFCYIYTNK